MINVNDVYGIFTVKEILEEKVKDGHRLYLIECNQCHKQFKKPLQHFAYRITKNCQHLSEDEIKEIAVNNWISEKHICEKCGNLMTKYYGTGRFCSKRCANSRKQIGETKHKISKSIKKQLKNTVKKIL